MVQGQQINDCHESGHYPGEKRADEAFFSSRFGSSGHALVNIETMIPRLARS
jgi:hypothetical protein